jgi:hypothetical protein
MIHIKSIKDAEKVKNPVHKEALKLYIKLLLEGRDYNVENEGWLCYIEAGDSLTNGFQHLTDGVGLLSGGLYDGVIHLAKEGLYEIIIVMNNEFVMAYFVPDELVTEELIQVILENDPSEEENVQVRLGLDQE